jgi:hypothetical protein
VAPPKVLIFLFFLSHLPSFIHFLTFSLPFAIPPCFFVEPQPRDSAPFPSSPASSSSSALPSPSWEQFRKAVKKSAPRGPSASSTSSGRSRRADAGQRASDDAEPSSSAGEDDEQQHQQDGQEEDGQEEDNLAGEESPYPEYLTMTPKRGNGGNNNSKLNRSLFSANGSPVKRTLFCIYS